MTQRMANKYANGNEEGIITESKLKAILEDAVDLNTDPDEPKKADDPGKDRGRKLVAHVAVSLKSKGRARLVQYVRDDDRRARSRTPDSARRYRGGRSHDDARNRSQA